MISFALFASGTLAILVLIFLQVLKTLRPLRRSSAKLTLTPLRGPPRASRLFGVTRLMRLSPNPKDVYVAWEKEYGSIFRIPLLFGSEAVVVSDLKAVAHIFGKDTFAYVRTPGLRVVIERVIGKGLLWAEGEDHRKQRKALNPAFSPGNVKNMAPLVYDNVYRLKSEWDKLLASSTSSQVEIEMHEWTMKLALDNIGRAAFGHDFHTVEGQHSIVEDALRMFNTTTPSGLEMVAYVTSIFVPWIGNLPTKRNKLFRNLSDSARSIFDEILREQKRAKEDSDRVEKGQKREMSPIERLIDAETDGAGLQSTEWKEEIVAQMQAILVAGTDPTGLIIVWSLIELARRPDIQAKIRAEVNTFAGVELDWDRLQSSCPFLDAVVSEILRMRPSFGETPRVADEDDILYLKEPMTDAAGHLTDKIYIPKGTKVIIPNHFLNFSPDIWGPDAGVFNPDRWLDDSQMNSEKLTDDNLGSAKGRLRTFGEGPRACLGKAFAMTQMKIVLAVLIREYTFALPQGPETPIDFHYSLIARPKIRGLDGAQMPLLVSRAT